MHRPVRPIDPNDAPEYEADLDAYDRHQSDLEDMEREQRVSVERGECDARFAKETGEIIIEDNNETEND